MHGTIQLIQITPDQLQDQIIQGVKTEIDSLKAEFQPKQPTEYLTRNEVKDFFRVDMSTIHNWTKRGKLKAYGIGNRIYYKRAEIEASIKPVNL